MIVSGDPIGADEALEGRASSTRSSSGDLTAARRRLRREGRSPRSGRSGRSATSTTSSPRRAASPRSSPSSASRWRAQTRGFRAPENCIKAVEAAVDLPFDQGIKRERELFQELMTSPESKAQRYFFFAEREAAKIPDVPADTPAEDDQEGGGDRRRHHGRRHRHELRQRRHPGDGGRDGPGARSTAASASCARTTRRPRRAAASRTADVEKRMGLITGTTDWNAVARRRHRHRGGVRGDADQEGGLRQARRHRQARRRAGHQHLHARRRRDRLGHQAAGERDRHALLQPRQRHAAARESCAARSRRRRRSPPR